MESTIKAISSEISQSIKDPEFNNLYSKFSKFKKLQLIFSILFGIFMVIAILGVLLLPGVIALILIVIIFISLILAIVFNKKARKLSKKIAASIDQVEWDQVYQKSLKIYQKNAVAPEFKKVEFKSLSRIRNTNSVMSFHQEPRDWIRKYNFLDNYQNMNHLELSYEGKDLLFKVNPTTECIVTKTRKDSKGNTVVEHEYHYITTYTLSLQNTKFDESYNGILLLPKKSKNPYFQTESIEFNKKYRINAESTDLRAAKFLRPKLIDKLMNLEVKNLNGIGVKSDFIVGKYNIDSGYSLKKITNQLSVFDQVPKASKYGPTYNFAKKVFNDISAIADCFQYLEGIY